MWLAAFSSSSVMPYVRPVRPMREVASTSATSPSRAAPRSRARCGGEVGAVGLVVRRRPRPAGRETNRPWMPSMRRPSSVSGRVQRNVPIVRRGSGLVKTSSVGMLARKRSPWTVVSSAALHLPPRAMPTSRSVPGARSTSRSRLELVEPVGARREHLDVPVPRVVRVVVGHATERRQVSRHLARRRGRVELGVDRRAPALERERDDAEPQRVALHLAQVDALAGDARRALARGAVGSAPFISVGADGPLIEMSRRAPPPGRAAASRPTAAGSRASPGGRSRPAPGAAPARRRRRRRSRAPAA